MSQGKCMASFMKIADISVLETDYSMACPATTTEVTNTNTCDTIPQAKWVSRLCRSGRTRLCQILNGSKIMAIEMLSWNFHMKFVSLGQSFLLSENFISLFWISSWPTHPLRPEYQFMKNAYFTDHPKITCSRKSKLTVLSTVPDFSIKYRKFLFSSIT